MSVYDNYTPIRVLGNGSTDEFSASWKVFNSDYLIVEFEDAADPTDITPQVLGSDYTLAFDDSGFVVTFNTAPPNTVYVRIYRSIALTQTDPYRTAKGFQGDTIEESFDKLTSISQDQQDFIDRGFYAPLGSSLATNTILGTINSTNKIVALSTDGPAVLDIDGDELEGLIAIEADISTVAGIASNVTTVAGIDTEVTTVSGISGSVVSVAGIAADVTTVAGIDTDVTSVAGIAADVSTVAGIAADVTAAANNIPKANRTATTNPTVNDDSGDGYSEGSLWVNTVSNAAFFCTDPALGAAVWTQIGIAATDLISAATSAGLVIKAANGTDVANFGAGNTANSTFYGNVSMNTTNKIVNMADPTSAQDAATKAYVDANAGGVVVQRDYVENVTVVTCSTAIPIDDTIPQITEGTEILSKAFTMTSATNILRITTIAQFSGGSAINPCLAIFNGATDAIDAKYGDLRISQAGAFLFSTIEIIPGVTTPVTYSVRVGGSNTMYVNGRGSSRVLGGVSRATMVLEEITP